MGMFDGAKATIAGNKAYRIHVDANKAAREGRPEEARAKYQEALRIYDQAAQLGNRAANIVLSHAILLMREGELEKGRLMLEELSRDQKLSDEHRFQLRVFYSIYLWRIGELDRAIETMGRAARFKMNSDVYGNLGMFWVYKARQTGEFDAALEFNQKAMDYDDEDASTLDNMGQLYQAMAEAEAGEKAEEYMKKALDYYKKAHAANPRQITTIYYLASLYHRAGQDDKARKLLSARDTLYFSAINPISREMMDALVAEVG